jgi:hypothetical protein
MVALRALRALWTLKHEKKITCIAAIPKLGSNTGSRPFAGADNLKKTGRSGLKKTGQISEDHQGDKTDENCRRQ